VLGIRFISSLENFKAFYLGLKEQQCPHCKLRGNLILHGFLRGYVLPVPKKPEKKQRGHRIFCSNRNRRKGCGRTFSILFATLIRKMQITTHQFSKFLQNILTGENIQDAFELESRKYSHRSRYKLYHKFINRQPFIRTQLLKISKIPEINDPHPLAQTMLHLKSCFPEASCPIEAFQRHFQTSIL
jgi:hypothetical protein